MPGSRTREYRMRERAAKPLHLDGSKRCGLAAQVLILSARVLLLGMMVCDYGIFSLSCAASFIGIVVRRVTSTLFPLDGWHRLNRRLVFVVH